MVVVKFGGRLGNQMFQYAFYLCLKKYNFDAAIDISDYQYVKTYNYELERIFGIEENCICKKSIIDYFKFKINRLFEKKLHFKLIKSNEYKEIPLFLLDLNKIAYNKTIIFHGWWQRFQYVNEVKEEIRKKFVFPSLDNRNFIFFNQYSNANTVFIHVRRGDYLYDKNLGSACSIDYYNDAINYMNEKVNDAIFIFFSDDIKWCKSVFVNINACFVDWNIGNESYRDMQLMSMCKHGIISNSTFSWWGAYLIKNNEKYVIAPKNWNTVLDSTLVCPNEWIFI